MGRARFSDAFAALLFDRTGVEMDRSMHRPQELQARLKRAAHIGGDAGPEPTRALVCGGASDAFAGDADEAEHDLDTSWSAEARDFCDIVRKLKVQDAQGRTHIDPLVRGKAFVTGFFQKLLLPGLDIQDLDADVAAFTNLTSLDVSENRLVEIAHLPQKLQVLHAYGNAVDRLQGAALPALLHLGLGSNRLTDGCLAPLFERWPQLISLDLSYNLLCDITALEDLSSLRLRHLYLLGNPVVLTPHYRVVMVSACPTLRVLDNLAVTEAELARAPQVADAHWAALEEVWFGVQLQSAKLLPRLLAAHEHCQGLQEKIRDAKAKRGQQADIEELGRGLDGLKARRRPSQPEDDAADAEEALDNAGKVEEGLAASTAALARGVVFEVETPAGEWVASEPVVPDEDGGCEDGAGCRLRFCVPLAADGAELQRWLRRGMGLRFRTVAEPEDDEAPEGVVFAGGHVQLASLLSRQPSTLDKDPLDLPCPPVPSESIAARVLPVEIADDPAVKAPPVERKDGSHARESLDQLLADAGLFKQLGKAVARVSVVLHDPPEDGES